ncbi:unnamed protein product, partial [Protopolystoma xenopodis]
MPFSCLRRLASSASSHRPADDTASPCRRPPSLHGPHVTGRLVARLLRFPFCYLAPPLDRSTCRLVPFPFGPSTTSALARVAKQRLVIDKLASFRALNPQELRLRLFVDFSSELPTFSVPASLSAFSDLSISSTFSTSPTLSTLPASITSILFIGTSSSSLCLSSFFLLSPFCPHPPPGPLCPPLPLFPFHPSRPHRQLVSTDLSDAVSGHLDIGMFPTTFWPSRHHHQPQPQHQHHQHHHQHQHQHQQHHPHQQHQHHQHQQYQQRHQHQLLSGRLGGSADTDLIVSVYSRFRTTFWLDRLLVWLGVLLPAAVGLLLFLLHTLLGLAHCLPTPGVANGLTTGQTTHSALGRSLSRGESQFVDHSCSLQLTSSVLQGVSQTAHLTHLLVDQSPSPSPLVSSRPASTGTASLQHECYPFLLLLAALLMWMPHYIWSRCVDAPSRRDLCLVHGELRGFREAVSNELAGLDYQPFGYPVSVPTHLVSAAYPQAASTTPLPFVALGSPVNPHGANGLNLGLGLAAPP